MEYISRIFPKDGFLFPDSQLSSKRFKETYTMQEPNFSDHSLQL